MSFSLQRFISADVETTPSAEICQASINIKTSRAESLNHLFSGFNIEVADNIIRKTNGLGSIRRGIHTTISFQVHLIHEIRQNILINFLLSPLTTIITSSFSI